MQGDLEEAIASLQQAIKLNPDKCRDTAKTDADFDTIRTSEQFQVLIQEDCEIEAPYDAVSAPVTDFEEE